MVSRLEGPHRGLTELLTTEEVQHMLQINQRTLYRLANNGAIPALRVGRQWRFRQRDIEEWLEGRRLQASRPFHDTPPGGTVADAEYAGGSSTPVPEDAHVLIVDADRHTREQLSKSLAGVGCRVDTAPDAVTAMDYLGMIAYDLLITEINMPGLDGLALVTEARRHRADLPAVVITSHSTEGAAIEAANLGVAGYFTKPLILGRVMATVLKALGQ